MVCFVGRRREEGGGRRTVSNSIRSLLYQYPTLPYPPSEDKEEKEEEENEVDDEVDEPIATHSLIQSLKPRATHAVPRSLDTPHNPTQYSKNTPKKLASLRSLRFARHQPEEKKKKDSSRNKNQ